MPIPRGSFAMGVPLPEDPSAKSRELYGNRVAALGKGRPTAPGNSRHRSVTSPAPISTVPNAQTLADANENDTKSSAPLVSNSTSHTIPPSTSPECRSLSGPIDRSDEVQQDNEEDTNCHQEVSIQLDAVSRPHALLETDSGFSEPIITTAKTMESTVSPVNSPSSAGPTVTTLSLGESQTPERVSSLKPVSSPHVEDLDHSASHKDQTTPSSVESQGRLPIAEPATSTVETRISVEQITRKETTTSPQLDRSAQIDSLTPPFAHYTTSAIPQLSLSSNVSPAEKLKGDTIPRASNINRTKANLPVDSISTPNVVFPSIASVNTHSAIGDLDDSIAMSLPPAAETGRRSFSAVVHRSDTDKRPDSRHSTTSKASTITSRPSSSSFKTGTDGGVVRSKRNFKHLGAVTADPPASSGIGDLADLLQDAAWLEQRLSDVNTTSDVPSALSEERLKAESGLGPLSPTIPKTEKAPQPVPASATATRSKGRGLILGSLIPVPSAKKSQSPVGLSPSTPSFQVHPVASGSPEEVSPTPPKSARARKYFSLRGALRNSRLSMSSEMSSDDSAPVATPPSPTFDFSIPQSQGHGNDSMSVRSMFSIRSNKSGKSESVHGSLRLSPRRSVSRASSFAERLLNRATKTKSLLDDPGEKFCL